MSRKIHGMSIRVLEIMDKLTEIILKRIEMAGEYELFISEDFIDIGPKPLINKTLSLLSKKGLIERVLRGVYYKPVFDALLGEYTCPNIEKLPYKIAEKNGWVIGRNGNAVLYNLRLSTQVPVHYIFVSSGPTKQYKYKNFSFYFTHSQDCLIKNISIRSLELAQALRVLVRYKITQAEMELVMKRLENLPEATPELYGEEIIRLYKRSKSGTYCV